jgi:APA family basic amino acid/polyamine antiporter
VVSAGVIVLRKQKLERPRASACRDHRILPGLSIVTCLVLVLMVSLPVETWVRFLVWLIVGFGVYFPFGRKHSTLAKEGA